MRLMSERELNILRGKAMAKVTTPEDTLAVLDHLTLLEVRLDDADMDDMLGTEGWRRFVGVPDAD
jgi:hypothetical protein